MDALFRDVLTKSPLIAILRHLAPVKALSVGEALIEAGVSIIEVPLNGRDALASLDVLAKNLSAKALFGAGTVLSVEDVHKAAACGARFVLSPNMDPEVIAETRRRGLASVPGVATPTEAFAALKAGATALKIFPGDMFSPEVVKALRVVLPPDALIIVSGGVNAGNIRAYIEAGVNGVGVQSALFAPELKPEEIRAKAKALCATARGE